MPISVVMPCGQSRVLHNWSSQMGLGSKMLIFSSMWELPILPSATRRWGSNQIPFPCSASLNPKSHVFIKLCLFGMTWVMLVKFGWGQNKQTNEKKHKLSLYPTPAELCRIPWSSIFNKIFSLCVIPLSFFPLPFLSCPITALCHSLCCLLPAGLRRQAPCWYHCLLCPTSHQPQPQP